MLTSQFLELEENEKAFVIASIKLKLEADKKAKKEAEKKSRKRH